MKSVTTSFVRQCLLTVPGGGSGRGEEVEGDRLADLRPDGKLAGIGVLPAYQYWFIGIDVAQERGAFDVERMAAAVVEDKHQLVAGEDHVFRLAQRIVLESLASRHLAQKDVISQGVVEFAH